LRHLNSPLKFFIFLINDKSYEDKGSLGVASEE
jgi:hypothetical protein